MTTAPHCLSPVRKTLLNATMRSASFRITTCPPAPRIFQRSLELGCLATWLGSGETMSHCRRFADGIQLDQAG